MTFDDDILKVRSFATAGLPLPIPLRPGLLCIIEIPHMPQESYEFLMRQLEVYKPAIVRSKPDGNLRRFLGETAEESTDAPGNTT